MAPENRIQRDDVDYLSKFEMKPVERAGLRNGGN